MYPFSIFCLPGTASSRFVEVLSFIPHHDSARRVWGLVSVLIRVRTLVYQNLHIFPFSILSICKMTLKK